jgi:hypothetical protein
MVRERLVRRRPEVNGTREMRVSESAAAAADDGRNDLRAPARPL